MREEGLVTLIVGLLGEGSGKTILASSLTSHLRQEGFLSAPFKPIGATEAWQNPMVLWESKARSVLVTGDSLILARSAGSTLAPEVINPIGLILTPLDPLRAGLEVRTLQGLLASVPSRAALFRVTYCYGGDRRESRHFINMDAIKVSPPPIASLVADVAKSLKPGPVRAGPELVESIIEGSVVEPMESCGYTLLSASEILVVESNSDVAAPSPLALKASLVLAVAPSRLLIVDGSRYSKAVTLLASHGRYASLTASEAVKLAGYIKSVELPLLRDPMEGYPRDALDPVIEELKSLVKD